MSVLLLGKFAKKLDLSPLIKLIDESTQKESKIILKTQAIHETKMTLEEEPYYPEFERIDYGELTFNELKSRLHLRGINSVSAVAILLEEIGEIIKCVDVNTELPGTIKEVINHENFLLACGKEFIGTGTPGLLLFDGVITNVKVPSFLKSALHPCISMDYLCALEASKSPEIFHKLLVNISSYSGLEEEEYFKGIRDLILTVIEGDFAFIFINLLDGSIIVSKDRFGKKSLLLHDQRDSLEQIFITPITFGRGCYKEIIGNTLISLDLKKFKCNVKESPYPASITRFPAYSIPIILEHDTRLIELENVLLSSIKKRITKSAMILFSGGIDSLLLAYFAHKVLSPEEEYVFVAKN